MSSIVMIYQHGKITEDTDKSERGHAKPDNVVHSLVLADQSDSERIIPYLPILVLFTLFPADTRNLCLELKQHGIEDNQRT